MLGRTIFVSLHDDHWSRSILTGAVQPLAVPGLRVDCFISDPSVGQFSRVIGRRIAASSVFIGIFDRSHTSNIAFETGKAVALGKPVILICRDLKDLPTMLSGTDAIVLGDAALEFEQLRTMIDLRIDAVLCGEFADERVRAHVAQLRRKPQKPSYSRMDSESGAGGHDALAVAIRLYHAGNFEAAIQLIEPALTNALSSASYFYLADSYFMAAEGLPEGERQFNYYQRMLQIADRGHARWPGDLQLHKTLGLAHLKCHNFDRAKQVFGELINAHPGYRLARYNMACIHAQDGALIDCVRVLRELLSSSRREESWRYLARLDPDFDPVWEEDLFQRLVYPTTNF